MDGEDSGYTIAKVGTYNEGTNECENMVDNPMKVKVGTVITLPSCTEPPIPYEFAICIGDGDCLAPGDSYTVEGNVTATLHEQQG